MGLRDWLKRLFQATWSAPALPEGWTDDMNVPLPPGRGAEEVVEFVVQSALRGTSDDETERLLAAEFNLSPDDAALARDRSFGGLVLAATRSPANCPDQNKDPLAWESFQHAIRDRAIVECIYPQFASKA